MNIGIIGSGTVAQTLGERLLTVGQAVMISARDPDAPKDLGARGVVPAAGVWATTNYDQGREAAAGGFAEAAAFGELLINATAGAASLDALGAAERADIEGKILIDLSNPLDFSHGMPPGLAFSNYDSLGERIQAAYPGARVVKTLNTVNCSRDGRSRPARRGDRRVRRRQRRRSQGLGDRERARGLAGLEPDHRPRRHHRRARPGDVPAALAAAPRRDRHGAAQREGGGRPLGAASRRRAAGAQGAATPTVRTGVKAAGNGPIHQSMDGRGRRRIVRATAAAALAAAAVALLVAATAPGRASAGPSVIVATQTPTTLKGLEAAARGERQQMARLETQMKVIRTQYDAAVAALNGVNLQLSQTRLQLGQTQTALARQSAVVGARLAAMYKMGSFSFVDVLAASVTLTDLQTQITFFRRLTEQDQRDHAGLAQLNTQAGPARRPPWRPSAPAPRPRRAASTQQRLVMSDKIAQRRAILDNLTRQIERILAQRSPGGGALATPVPLSGHYTPLTWAKALLQQLGMPLTAANIAALTAWELAEGGHWHNSAHYNPLNTTMPEPGATAMNSVGVKAYVSWTQGFTATIATLRNGYYGGILAALRAGDDAIAVADAVAASPWGTGNFASLL